MEARKGVTLVEVMIALVVALIIAIGLMSYQYATAIHARKTDNRVTASRLALMISNSMTTEKSRIYPSVIDGYDMTSIIQNCGIGIEPLNFYSQLSTIDALNGIPATGSPFGYCKLFTNGTWFWFKLTYEDTWPAGNNEAYPLRLFTVVVAWSDDTTNESILNYNHQRCIIIPKYHTTYPPPPTP